MFVSLKRRLHAGRLPLLADAPTERLHVFEIIFLLLNNKQRLQVFSGSLVSPCGSLCFSSSPCDSASVSGRLSKHDRDHNVTGRVTVRQ